MRLVHSLVLTAILGMLAIERDSPAAAEMVHPHFVPAPQILHAAKIVCSTVDGSFKCRNEPGAVRRGKMRKIPGSSSDDSSGGLFDSGEEDALPPTSDSTGTGTAQPAPRATPTSCPKNSELLGGHCIPYTQTCNTGSAANANPQPCQRAEEKQVCSIRSDGTKDCCCRTYAKF